MSTPVLNPVALAGVRFQSRPVQTVPSGAIDRCCAMSLQPFVCVWNAHIPSIVASPAYVALVGLHV